MSTHHRARRGRRPAANCRLARSSAVLLRQPAAAQQGASGRRHSRRVRAETRSAPGTNYAQARYLLYYLQEKGLLVRYYRAFFADRRTDPTGYQTLKRVLGERDMDAFHKRWQAFVLGLSFP